MAKQEAPASQLKLRSMLDEDKPQYNDCLSCRVVGMAFLPPITVLIKLPKLLLLTKPGATAFIALGTYTYISGTTSLRANKNTILKSGSMFGIKSRQTALAGTSLMLVGAGIYRLLN